MKLKSWLICVCFCLWAVGMFGAKPVFRRVEWKVTNQGTVNHTILLAGNSRFVVGPGSTLFLYEKPSRDGVICVTWYAWWDADGVCHLEDSRTVACAGNEHVYLYDDPDVPWGYSVGGSGK